MENGCFCKAATCEIAVTTAENVSYFATVCYDGGLSSLYYKVAVWEAGVKSFESRCRVCGLRACGEFKGELSLELRPVRGAFGL